MPLLLALLVLQRLYQKFACPVAFSQLIPHLEYLALLRLLLDDLRALLLEVGGELVEHALQELAAQKSLAAPSSAQRHFLQDQRVQADIVDGEMHVLILLLLVEEVLVESLHEDVQRLVGKLSTAYQVLSFFYACFSDRRVGLDIDEGEISLEGLVEPFASDCDSEDVVGVAPGIVGGDIDGAYFAVLGAHYLHPDGLVYVLLHDLKGRQLSANFGRRTGQLVEYLRGRSLSLGRGDLNDEVEKGLDLAPEGTVGQDLNDPVAFALLQWLVAGAAVAHQQYQ